VALLGESDRKIYRDGGFADAAFAAGDGDEIFYAGNRLAWRELLGLRCWRHFALRPFRLRAMTSKRVCDRVESKPRDL
jgi:hypothetical protein